MLSASEGDFDRLGLHAAFVLEPFEGVAFVKKVVILAMGVVTLFKERLGMFAEGAVGVAAGQSRVGRDFLHLMVAACVVGVGMAVDDPCELGGIAARFLDLGGDELLRIVGATRVKKQGSQVALEIGELERAPADLAFEHEHAGEKFFHGTEGWGWTSIRIHLRING